MSVTRPHSSHAPLPLDEQAFQGLLAAAFTIQEHNDRKRGAGFAEETTEPSASTTPEVSCPHCGARKKSVESRCASCGKDELRPGEKLQRNWASLWLMSQEQGLFPERFSGSNLEHEGLPVSYERPRFRMVESEPAVLRHSVHRDDDAPATEELPASMESGASGNDDSSQGDDAFSVAPAHADEKLLADEMPSAGAIEPPPVMNRLSDLQVTLRFDRANLYLGLAVFVALVALLWPAAAVQKRTGLSPWERALVKMGIAEAPAPQLGFRGNPDAQVWVDPHTALYYCPGAESYGKTPNGRYASQRDAQVDRFEPAERSVCE